MADYAGRYAILALLGEGAHATVYRAHDREVDEDVALKVLRPEVVGTPILVEHFRREVRLARRITHRNVARVFDIGEHDGERFLTMEFIDGEPLSELLSRSRRQKSPLGLVQVVAIARQVCAGLVAAHAAGVIHRDLKPANIMLTSQERVVLTDFGIARPLRQEEGAPATEGIWGSPAYMAPEQFNTPQQVDERADLYALGGVLFELLTGRVPFIGESWIDVAMMRITTAAPDPRTLRSDLPEPLAQLVLRCLARKPEDRFPSAAEVDSALLPLAQSLASSGAAEISAEDIAEEVELTQIIEVSRIGPPTAPPTQPVAPRIKTLAVLPFLHAGADSDLYLADGLTDLFIEQLGAVRGLRVRSRGAVMELRGDSRSVRALGQVLGVQVVLSGELQVEGDTATVSLRLHTVEHGLDFWSRSVREKVSALMPACLDLVRAVAKVLTVDPPTEAALLRKSQVADLYLRGRHLYHRGDLPSLQQSLAPFEEALRSEPDDPLILTAYGMACARLWFFGEARAGERANAAAARAVAVAPHRAESHLAMAMVYFQYAEMPRAAYELRCALAYASHLGEARDLTGRLLIETGPLREGFRQLEFARRQDPSLRRVSGDMARACALLGVWDQVDQLLSLDTEAATAQKHADAQPNAVLLWRGIWGHRGRFALWRRDAHAARQDLQNPLFAKSGTPLARTYLEVAAGGPQVDPALVLDRAILGHASARGRCFFYQMHVEIYSYYGATEQALHALAQAVAEGLFDLMWMENCPLFEALRRDARYEILKTVVAHRAKAVHGALGWAD